MKIVKILLILLVPAVGFVSCNKSGVKPKSCGDHSQEQKVSATDDIKSDDSKAAARPLNTNNTSVNTSPEENGSLNGSNELGNNTTIVGDDTPETSEIYGSSDDDRDGGDRKKKR